MNTTLHLPSLPRLSHVWPVAALRHWVARARQPAMPAGHLEGLSGLDARTLRDIGAPDRLVARELTRRADEQRRRDELAVGVVAGAWRHW